jgi:signal transduction histidine kinase/DNA-binding response OmpR family regulator/ligand-binding sensor domain-containing protein
MIGRVMKLKFGLFALILTVILLFPTKVQAARFYSVNSLFGISLREVNSVCEDENGFIWASSKMGVLRVTKFNYRIYHLSYETTSAFKIKLVYKNSRLYVYTNNGQFFVYNSVSDRFDPLVEVSNFITKNQLMVFDMLVDNNDALWISTSGGVCKSKGSVTENVLQFSSNRYATNWFDGQKLVIAKQDGIWLLDTKTSESKRIYENQTPYVFNFFSLHLDETTRKLWLGSVSSGLLVYDFDNGKCVRILESVLPEQPILTIKENSDATMMLGFDGQGIWELDRHSFKVLNVFKENIDDIYSLRGNGIYDLHRDKTNTIWICSYTGGLLFYDQASSLVNRVFHQTNNTNSLVNNDVNSIIEDKWGKLWFATNNGICSWDQSSNKWKSYYNDKSTHAQVFLTLCEDDHDRIWAGTYSSGVYVLDSKTGRELAHYTKNDKNSPLENDFIFNIYKDSWGDIWLGSLGGALVCYRESGKSFKKYSQEFIVRIGEIENDKLLLGCSTQLSTLDKQTGETKRLATGLLVRDFCIIGKEIWICTGGNGLVKYDMATDKTVSFTTENGLPSNFINGVIFDKTFLWLGTENGICKFDPRNNSVETYSAFSSLYRASFNTGSRLKLKSGLLAWGSNNGVVFFAPELINESTPVGNIFFQDLLISGTSIRDIDAIKLKNPIDKIEKIDLKYFQNTVSIELVAIGQSPGLKFSWNMKNFDSNWSNPSTNSVITYTNLPSGEYTLKIKLFDSSLSRVLDERTLQIKITPPFWKTIWFIILAIVTVLAIATLYFLYYINRLKQRHTEEKVRFFANTAHDIRTSLTLIKAPIEELTKETNLSNSGRHFLHLANTQANQLSSAATQLLDFQKLDVGKEKLSLSMIDIVLFVGIRKEMYQAVANSRNITIDFSSNRPQYKTAVDEMKIEKVIDNIISNAIKYSLPGGRVRIDLECFDDKWIFQVQDWGIGINRKAQRKLFKEFYRGENAVNSKTVGSGIGLILIKKYVEMHGGTVNCVSAENSGSTFKTVIPFKSIASHQAVTEETGSALKYETDTFGDNLKAAEAHESEKLKARELKVLIVEDNEDLAHFMQMALGADFNVVIAKDGEKAWELISKQMPDMVVSDVLMPNMDGFELCTLIKSTYKTSHLPVILLTALNSRTDQLQGLRLGADDYLTKPFDMTILIQRIRTIVSNREKVKEKALKIVNGNSDEQILENELNDNFLKKMMEVVKANISNSEFTKDDFAMAMNVSSSLLYKKVKALTDLSPIDFIKIIRLNHAIDLLKTKKYTVTEVSELCGFANAGYFSTVFRKHFGKSPTELIE